MAPRKTFEGGLVGGINIPSIGFEQYKAQASMFSDLETRLNTITKFALQKGTEAALDRAEDFVASNPLTYNKVVDLSKEEKEDLIPSKNNAYAKKVRELQSNALSLDIEVKAKMAITNLELKYKKQQAETGTIDSVAYDNEVSAVINGYTDAMAGINIGEANKLQASLNLSGSASYKSILENEITTIKAKRINEAETLAIIDSLDNVKLIEQHGLTVLSVNPDRPDAAPIETNVDDIIRERRKQTYDNLLSAGSPKTEELIKEDIEAEKEAYSNYIKKSFIDTDPINIKDTYAIADNITNEKNRFNGNKKLLDVWNTLGDKEKRKIIESAEKWEKDKINEIEAKEKVVAERLDGTIQESVSNYYEAIANNNINKAQQIVDDMELFTGKGLLLGDKLYKEVSQDLIAAKLDVTTDPTILQNLTEKIIFGTANYEDISIARNNRQITSADTISLREKFITTNEAFINKKLQTIAADDGIVLAEEQFNNLLDASDQQGKQLILSYKIKNDKIKTKTNNFISNYMREYEYPPSQEEIIEFMNDLNNNLSSKETKQRNANNTKTMLTYNDYEDGKGLLSENDAFYKYAKEELGKNPNDLLNTSKGSEKLLILFYKFQVSGDGSKFSDGAFVDITSLFKEHITNQRLLLDDR